MKKKKLERIEYFDEGRIEVIKEYISCEDVQRERGGGVELDFRKLLKKEFIWQ